MTPILLIWLIGHIVVHAEIANNGPLVYHSWPPISSKRTHSATHQLAPQPHHRHQQQSHHHGYHHPNMHTSSAAQSQLPMHTSSSATGPYLPSPSNVVYSQQKLRPHQTMALLNMQHNRLVRPSSMLKISAASNPQPHYLMPSVKPAATHIATYPSHQHYGVAALKPHAATRNNQQQHPMIATSSTRATFVKIAPGPNKNLHTAKKNQQPNQKPMVDYVFEKPNMSHYGSLPLTASASASAMQLQPNVISTLPPLPSFGTARPLQSRQPLTGIKYNPIHTIQAPNLSLHEQKPFASVLNTPLLDSNHLFEKDTMFPTHLAFTADRPTSIPQYQVTESPHDYAVRNTVPLFLGGPNLQMGPMSSALIGDQHQHPSTAFVEQQFTGPGNQPAASVLVPQHLSFPTTNQLKQSGHHQSLLQQFSGQMNTVPQAAYNPTYLVTQSNQLFDQHKQHLFNPERQYLHQQQHVTAQRHPSADATIESEFLPSFQLPSGDYVQLQSNPLPQPLHNQLILNQSSSLSTNLPHHVSSIEIQQQPVSAALSAQEVSNLLNYGSLQPPTSTNEQRTADGFVASNFYQTNNKNAPTSLSVGITGDEDSIYRHQQENEERINAATRQQQAMLIATKQLSPARIYAYQTKRPEPTESTIFVTRSPELRASEAEAESAHQRHQQRVSEHMAATSDMRIYVPDEDYSTDQLSQSDTFNKRSDDFESDENGKNLSDLTMSASSNYNGSSDGETEHYATDSAAKTEVDELQTEFAEQSDSVPTTARVSTPYELGVTTTEYITTLDNAIVVNETTDKPVVTPQVVYN